MNQPVEDGIGDGRLVERLVAVAHGQLAGDDVGAEQGAVFDHLQQVGGLPSRERLEGKVIG